MVKLSYFSPLSNFLTLNKTLKKNFFFHSVITAEENVIKSLYKNKKSKKQKHDKLQFKHLRIIQSKACLHILKVFAVA